MWLKISYHDLLLDFPFKGDEMALRNMEHAELISIITQNGKLYVLRPSSTPLMYLQVGLPPYVRVSPSTDLFSNALLEVRFSSWMSKT